MLRFWGLCLPKPILLLISLEILLVILCVVFCSGYKWYRTVFNPVYSTRHNPFCFFAAASDVIVAEEGTKKLSRYYLTRAERNLNCSCLESPNHSKTTDSELQMLAPALSIR